MRASDRLQIYPDVPLPDVLKPVVVDKCRGAVALGLSLGALTLIDDILTVRRLRFHPESRISLLLTPEGKLRASYLGLGVKGRPTTLQCVGCVRATAPQQRLQLQRSACGFTGPVSVDI